MAPTTAVLSNPVLIPVHLLSALDAYGHHKPFYVVYNVQEFRIDLTPTSSMPWWRRVRNVYDVEYSSRAWSADDVGAGTRAKLCDGGKIFAEGCSKPVVLRKLSMGTRPALLDEQKRRRRLCNP